MARKTKTADGFSAEERAAMRDRAKELKSRGKTDGEADIRAAIDDMGKADKAIATRIHAIVQSLAPELAPRTWYGMPAWAKDGKVVCFFQSAGKFKARYPTLGFSDQARLDEGDMWPTSFAITELSAQVEKRIEALVTRAVG